MPGVLEEGDRSQFVAQLFTFSHSNFAIIRFSNKKLIQIFLLNLGVTSEAIPLTDSREFDKWCPVPTFLAIDPADPYVALFSSNLTLDTHKLNAPPPLIVPF